MENSYFRELTRSLQQSGFAVRSEEDNTLLVELAAQPLCRIAVGGRVMYNQQNFTDTQAAALELVTTLAHTTAAYMRQMEAAPRLTASGLSGDYRLLAEFDGVILAGHHTSQGTQFITWERDYEGTGVHHGHYYGFGADSYIAAKQDFAVRSGLIQSSALFQQEQTDDLSQDSMTLC